jgi:hypothetical protein
MFGLFAKKLTEYSNHYLDWSRIGELLKSGTHRYSKEELKVRGSIIAFTAVSAFLGAYFNDKEKTRCANLTVALAAGLLGFTVSHTVALYPLIKKRLEMKQDCLRLMKEIEIKMKNSTSLSQAERHSIQAVLEGIITLSLSDTQHSKASQTWGRRKHLLTKVSEHLDRESYGNSLWQGNVAAIIEKLTADTETQARPKIN